jgi:NAD(P)-dependent dehydrogenase (short-subunit alcohol dehydrogenase family)
MTRNLRSAIGETSKLAMELAGDLAAGSIGDPEDIANAVVYLASDESRFVNGSMLAIDDGLTAG